MSLFSELILAHLHIVITRGKISFSKGPTQGLGDTTLPAEVIYPINYTQPNKKFLLSLHYSGSNSFLFINEKNISIQSKKL